MPDERVFWSIDPGKCWLCGYGAQWEVWENNEPDAECILACDNHKTKAFS